MSHRRLLTGGTCSCRSSQLVVVLLLVVTSCVPSSHDSPLITGEFHLQCVHSSTAEPPSLAECTKMRHFGIKIQKKFWEGEPPPQTSPLGPPFTNPGSALALHCLVHRVWWYLWSKPVREGHDFTTGKICLVMVYFGTFSVSKGAAVTGTCPPQSSLPNITLIVHYRC